MLAGFPGKAPCWNAGADDGGNGDRNVCCTYEGAEPRLPLFQSCHQVAGEGESAGLGLAPACGAVPVSALA